MKNNLSSPAEVFRSLVRNHELIRVLAWRDVSGRYRGTAMGIGWAFVTPLLMLAVYTFVFSEILGARWGSGPDSGHGDFALSVFAGMLVHGIFSDCINRAPGLVMANPNYVQKVVFPLEILPFPMLGSALFHAGISLFVLVGACLLVQGGVSPSVLLAPLVLAPLVLALLGISWILASLGVYLRDISHTTGIVSSVMLFLSPVFYPVSSAPEVARNLLALNPLTFPIEQLRKVSIAGDMPDWSGLFVYVLAAGVFAWLGFWWFQKTRKGFADVL